MAKRMALVPMDFVAQTKEAPLLNQLSTLDKEMETVLKDSGSTDLKFRKYQDALRRYQHLTNVRDEGKIAAPQRIVEDEILPSLPAQQIIRNMPNQKQRSAKILLDFLATLPELAISDNNEIIIDGNSVKNSNIHDLVADLTRDKLGDPPRGFNEFFKLLKRRNVPMEAIGSQRRKNLFQHRKYAHIIGSSESLLPSTSSRGRQLSSDDFKSGSRFSVLNASDDDEDVPKSKRSKKLRSNAVGDWDDDEGDDDQMQTYGRKKSVRIQKRKQKGGGIAWENV